MYKLNIRKAIAGALLSTAALAATSTFAADFDVEIQNLTSGIVFTPFVVAAHTDDSKLFTAGEAASAGIQAMAEGGDISGLAATLTSISATQSNNPAGGLLMPAASATTTLNTDGTDNVRLSVMAMLLPTNDAFAALNAITIPTEAGTYVYNLPAYDAGTEANDEILNGGGAPGTPGMPGDPGGLAGTGATGVAAADTNTSVHIHRGALGDTEATSGSSDLDSRIHRWLNPVVRVTVTVR